MTNFRRLAFVTFAFEMIRFLVLSFLAVGAFGASKRHFGYGINPQIVGGENAVQGEFPYQLAIRNYYGKIQFCGASIVSEDTAVTAAHCVDDFKPSELEILAGDINKIDISGLEQIFRVKKILIYPRYVDYLSKDDIALLKIDGKFTFNENVAPIALPAPYEESSGTCTVTGWGKVRTGGPTAQILQKVDVTVISDIECKIMYDSEGYKIRANTLCAGDIGKDSCQGDSGGPLKCIDEDGSEYLAGIVSWGFVCGDPSHPGVYAEVSFYVGWIRDNS